MDIPEELWCVEGTDRPADRVARLAQIARVAKRMRKGPAAVDARRGVRDRVRERRPDDSERFETSEVAPTTDDLDGISEAMGAGD